MVSHLDNRGIRGKAAPSVETMFAFWRRAARAYAMLLLQKIEWE